MGLGQDQQQHPAVQSGGNSRGAGPMAVAVGVSDMWQMTGDMQHVKPDT